MLHWISPSLEHFPGIIIRFIKWRIEEPQRDQRSENCRFGPGKFNNQLQSHQSFTKLPAKSKILQLPQFNISNVYIQLKSVEYIKPLPSWTRSFGSKVPLGTSGSKAFSEGFHFLKQSLAIRGSASHLFCVPGTPQKKWPGAYKLWQ
jgi:hypothetical protein